jgi:hypothetical protein
LEFLSARLDRGDTWRQRKRQLLLIGSQDALPALKRTEELHKFCRDDDYGRETIPILDHQAAQYGFAVQHLSFSRPGLGQKATLRVKVAQPDWAILRRRRGSRRATVRRSEEPSDGA